MRVALLVSSLSAAGAERWNANLANLLHSRGVEVLVLTYQKELPDFYSLATGIERQWADFSVRGWPKILSLRNTIATWAPDVVVASGNKTNVRALMAGFRQSWKTVVVEHNDPSQQPIELRWGIARFFVYRLASRLVSISWGVDRYFWFLPRRLRVVIPNTFPEHSARRRPGVRKAVVAVGRLVPIKGFDRLIRAFARFSERFPDWKLTIWGEGPERQSLTALSRDLGVETKVNLPGLTDDPLSRMSESDFLVLTSLSEGFGNVLVEAMSVGLPVISFDCPSGPRDIVKPGSGILVPNGRIDLLAEAMVSLAAADQKREALAIGALARAEAFSPKNHAERWLQLLGEVTVSR